MSAEERKRTVTRVENDGDNDDDDDGRWVASKQASNY